MSEQRSTRRQFLQASLRLVGGAGAYSAAARLGVPMATMGSLAGCMASRSPQELVNGIVQAIIGDIRSFDPAYIVMALDGYINANIHEPLTWHNKKVQLVPRLALSWEPSNEARRWRFKLRPGVRFHDGAEFNAEAVKIHFDRIKDPKAKSERVSRVAPMDSVQVIDPLTVEFILNRPIGVWAEQIRSSWGFIVSPKRLAELEDQTKYRDHPMGTGPFRFVEYVPDEFIRLERNPDYWDPDAILFKDLEFRVVKEATTRLILVEHGQLDIAPIGYAHVDLAKASDKIQLIRSPHLATSYVGLNCMRAPLNNPAVRRAINKAVDREKIVAVALRGAGGAAVGPVPKQVIGKNPAVTGYTYDPDAARKELKEAGVKQDTKLILWSTDRAEERLQCELLKEMLREVGLEIEPVIINSTAYWGTFNRYQRRDGLGNVDWHPNLEGVFDMFIAGWVGGETAWGFMEPLFRSTSTSNNAFYKNETVDQLLAQAMGTQDENEKTQLFQTVEAMVVADAPWLFMYDREITLAVRPGLENYTPHPAGEYEFQGVRPTANKQKS